MALPYFLLNPLILCSKAYGAAVYACSIRFRFIRFLAFIHQIMDYMKVQVKADMTQMELQLNPASLGTVVSWPSSKVKAFKLTRLAPFLFPSCA